MWNPSLFCLSGLSPSAECCPSPFKCPLVSLNLEVKLFFHTLHHSARSLMLLFTPRLPWQDVLPAASIPRLPLPCHLPFLTFVSPTPRDCSHQSCQRPLVIKTQRVAFCLPQMLRCVSEQSVPPSRNHSPVFPPPSDAWSPSALPAFLHSLAKFHAVCFSFANLRALSLDVSVFQ